jgi:hypothetical protein
MFHLPQLYEVNGEAYIHFSKLGMNSDQDSFTEPDFSRNNSHR